MSCPNCEAAKKPRIKYANIEDREDGKWLAIDVVVEGRTFAGYLPLKKRLR